MLLNKASVLSEPFLDLLVNVIANRPDSSKLLLIGALEGARVGKAPVYALAPAGKHRAAFGIAFVTNGHHVIECFASIDIILCRFCILPLHGDADLFHGLHHQGIEIPCLDSAAVHFEAVRCIMADKRLAHLASCRIMDAYKHDSFLAHPMVSFAFSLDTWRFDRAVHHIQDTRHDKDTGHLCSFTSHINDSYALEGGEML